MLEADSGVRTPATKYHETIFQAKKEAILKVFKEASGDHAAAAKLLGVDPKYLYRLIRNMNLKEVLGK